MTTEQRSSTQRIAIGAAIIAVVVLVIALASGIGRDAAEPTEPEPTESPRPTAERSEQPVDADDASADDADPADGGPDDASPMPTPPDPVPAADEPPEQSPPERVEPRRPEVSLEQAAARLRVEIAERMPRQQLEMLAGDRLLERIVTTLHSLDGEAVPLRFRPLAHVPGLPRIDESGEQPRLPDEIDPRYAAYREVFDRFSVQELAGLFDRNEAALQRAWEAMGETVETSFRERTIEVLNHLAATELPERRPALVRPDVLYEYADPELEGLSWGRKLLIRIGPEHAEPVRRKAARLADELAASGSSAEAGG